MLIGIIDMSNYLVLHTDNFDVYLIAASGEFPTDIQNVRQGSLTMLLASENQITPVQAENFARAFVYGEIDNYENGWIEKPIYYSAWVKSVDKDSTRWLLKNKVMMAKGVGLDKYSIDYNLTEEDYEVSSNAVAKLSLSYIVLRGE